MAYWKDKWEFTNSNEYEYKYAGKYGAKGEKRAKKKKATPEQIKKQNQTNREKKMSRLITANFVADDLWNTLKYPRGTRKPLGEVLKDKKNFLKLMRKEYKKIGVALKFICRIEIGKHGGIHIHILINRIKGMDTDLLIQKCWENGCVNHESIYDQGGFKKLASYIVKQPDEEIEEQLKLFPEEQRKILLSISTSRNLIRPEPDRTECKRRTVKKLIENGPEPTPGYYIDQDSIHYGVNPYTGMSYYHYTEYKIEVFNQKRGAP